MINPRTGKSYVWSEDQRKKKSLSMMGDKHYLFGKHFSEDTRLKSSVSHTGTKWSEDSKNRFSDQCKGRPVSKEARLKISKSLKGKSAGSKNPMFGKSPIQINSRSHEGLDHIVRSSYEEKVFLFLKTNGIEYEYEPLRFFIKHEEGNMTYAVDARIKNTNIFIEVKGWCDPVSELKMREFRRQYPENELWVVTSKKGIKNIPKYCYDKIFNIDQLNVLLDFVRVLKIA